MRPLVAAVVVATACGSDPSPPPPAPLPPPSPPARLLVATDEPPAPLPTPPAGVAAPPERTSLTARVVPGMERVDFVALTDVGVCVLAGGKAPLCMNRSEPARFLPSPQETLRKWFVADGIDCRLSTQNELDCFGLSGAVSMTAVQDFVLAADLNLYTLSNGTVTLTELSRERSPRTRAAIFRNAVAIQELSGVAACARSSAGQVTCTDEGAPFDAPTNVVRGIARATQLAPGFVRDDTGTLFGIGEAEAGVDHAWGALRLGGGIVDMATVGLPGREVCVLLSGGNVRCRPTRRGEAEERAPAIVTLPRAARRFHPASAPCVELENGTVACWGSDVERLAQLGLRVLETTPGAIAPR